MTKEKQYLLLPPSSPASFSLFRFKTSSSCRRLSCISSSTINAATMGRMHSRGTGLFPLHPLPPTHSHLHCSFNHPRHLLRQFRRQDLSNRRRASASAAASHFVKVSDRISSSLCLFSSVLQSQSPESNSNGDATRRVKAARESVRSLSRRRSASVGANPINFDPIRIQRGARHLRPHPRSIRLDPLRSRLPVNRTSPPSYRPICAPPINAPTNLSSLSRSEILNLSFSLAMATATTQVPSITISVTNPAVATIDPVVPTTAPAICSSMRLSINSFTPHLRSFISRFSDPLATCLTSPPESESDLTLNLNPNREKGMRN